jgi:hypothetical protein
MKRFFLVSVLFLFLTSNQAQEYYLASAETKAVTAHQYVYEVKTQDGQTLYCHEIAVFDKEYALMVTYCGAADDTHRVESYIDLANIKQVKSIIKYQ